MSLRRGIARAAAGAPVRVREKGAMQMLTLDNPVGWETGGDLAGMSCDRAMKISTVNRCVEVISNAMAVLPTYVMDENTKKRLENHRLGSVLWGRPNEAMTSFDFTKLLMVNQMLRGNAYAWSFRDPRTGHIRERIPLAADYVTQTWVEGRRWYIYSHPVTGKLYWLRPEDVTHYKAYSEDGMEGISILRRASLTLDTARAAQQYENSTWNNNGQPSGILTTDSDLGELVEVLQPDGTKKVVDPKQQLRESWESIHRGPGNAFRVAVLDLGLKYQPISMTNADAQFVESNEVRVADICRFFGMPLHLAYAGKQSYQSNEQNNIEFVNFTLLGYETQWSQEDSYKLLLPSERSAGQRVKKELKVFLKGDTAAQASWYRAMREIGAYSVNNILGLEDMPPVPGGDTRYASWNYGPLEDFVRLSAIRALGGGALEKEMENT